VRRGWPRSNLLPVLAINGALTNLERLRLEETKVRDAGLVNLKGLPKLRELILIGTQVTDAGVAELQKAFPKWQIRK
jgi:hypothetical protein